jgi:hypothetical protein
MSRAFAPDEPIAFAPDEPRTVRLINQDFPQGGRVLASGRRGRFCA